MAWSARWLPRLWSNWISLLGVAITTVTGLALVLGIAAELMSSESNVYATAILLMVVPFIFMFGLLLIPLGLFIYRKREARDAALADGESLRGAFATIASNKILRRRVIVVGALTFVNVLLIGGATQQAIHFMDSPEFCGTVCHEVMAPEYEAYKRSPHSRVACVDCHIGPGASWAVKAKIDGLRQVWGVITNDFHRPIPAPVHTLRPARDTCEKCHWTEKFHGNRVQHTMHYLKDEANTEQINLFVLKVGGQNPSTGRHEGIHWHVRPDIEIRYEALDEKREKIGKVQVYENGTLRDEYLAPKASQSAAAVDTRTMDCIDCHNRPTHLYDGPPAAALDLAFEAGRMDKKVKWLRTLAEPLLKDVKRDRDTAESQFLTELTAAYTKEHPEAKPDAATLAKAAAGLAEVYRRNIWPTMEIGWDTYPTHLGHRGDEGDMRGCFRCHDEEHATKEGKAITQDCTLCHEFLAEDENYDKIDDSLKSMIFRSGE